MGKTPTALRIKVAVSPEYLDRPEFQALAAKGHVVEALVCDADLILHPAAHAWDPGIFDKPVHLEAAIRRARERKRRAK